MDLKRQWCAQPGCRDSGKVGIGNIKVYSFVERRYYCTTCLYTFNADVGTFFATLRSERTRVLETIAMLGERNSLRAIERLKQRRPNTVLHWLDLAGQHSTAVSAELIHDLHLTQAQVDELWTFVKKNKRIANLMTRWTSVTLGFGEPSLCRVGCGWSAISVMSAAKPKPPSFWRNLRPVPQVARRYSPVTSCPPTSPPWWQTIARRNRHPSNAGQADLAKNPNVCSTPIYAMPRWTNGALVAEWLKSNAASFLERQTKSLVSCRRMAVAHRSTLPMWSAIT